VTTTTDYPFTPGELAGLRSACAAVVAAPGDDRYDEEVATWNLAVRLRPGLAVGARTADDVVNAVRWAARLGVAIGVNATGHGAVPNADGALLINTSRLAQVTIDPVSATATVGAGARMGAVTAAAARHGLTPVQGSSGSAGAAGFTLGGGLGVLSRTFGLAADRVLSIDVVTSDGQLRTVDADHHPELFWALRGGKGNFGVVTSYRTALEPLAAFYGGGIFFDGAHAADVLHAYRRWISGLTERTSSSVALLHLPSDPAVPEPVRGRYVAHLRLAHAGDSAEGARLADGIRPAAPVLLEALGDLPVTSLDVVHQDPPGPVPVHERGCLLDQLTPDTIDAVVREASAPGSPLMMAEIRQLGGAIARDPAVPNAVPGRTAPFILFAIALDIPPLDEAGPRAVAALLDAVRPWRSPVTLPNFLGRSCTPAEVQAAWPDQTRARLLDIKQGWDLDNVFRVGHALLPAPAPAGVQPESSLIRASLTAPPPTRS
jgi:FAD/FMN-containing dehydrogenase